MEEAKNLPFQLNLLGEKTNCALYSGSLRRILQALRCESEKLLSTTIETFCLSGSPLKDGVTWSDIRYQRKIGATCRLCDKRMGCNNAHISSRS